MFPVDCSRCEGSRGGTTKGAKLTKEEGIDASPVTLISLLLFVLFGSFVVLSLPSSGSQPDLVYVDVVLDLGGFFLPLDMSIFVRASGFLIL
jgi:hypothetical protein